MLHEAFGWRSTFIACVAFSLALGPVVATAPARDDPGQIDHAPVLRGDPARLRTLLGHPGYRVYVALSALAYGGLFAFISGSSFVLQGVYGLAELPFAFSFAFMVLGFIGGTFLAQRVVGRLGLDGTIGLGVVALALGGATMLALVAFGRATSLPSPGRWRSMRSASASPCRRPWPRP